MKTLILTTLLATWTASAVDYGTVWFDNRVAFQIKTHVYTNDAVCEQIRGNGTNDFPAGTQDWTGFTPIEGVLNDAGQCGFSDPVFFSPYLAQLFSAPGAGIAETNLLPASQTTCFDRGPRAGQVMEIIASLRNVPPDAPAATVMMVVWENKNGSINSWSTAKIFWEAGLIRAGTSGPFDVFNIGGNFTVPPYLTSLTSFNIYYRHVDIGLRAYDGSATIKIGCGSGSLASPLRISKNGTNYGILLVATNAANASRIRIPTSSGIKAMRKLP